MASCSLDAATGACGFTFDRHFGPGTLPGAATPHAIIATCRGNARRCHISMKNLRLLALLLACLALAAPLHAADDAVTLNFVNADIDAVVRAVAEMTGRNFVVDPRVKGVINIVSARPVPRSAIYPTLLSALRL